MTEPARGKLLRAGWLIVFAVSVLFAVISIAIAVTPLPGEEDYAGTTFANLQRTNPRIANVIWHDYVAFGILLLGVSIVAGFLAWKGLSKGSTMAWYSLVIIGVTFIAFLLLAHLPIGHTFAHYGPLLILAAIFLAGLGVSAKPVLSK